MLSFLSDALATHRLTKLIIDDKITEDLREKVFARFGNPDDSKISYLITCPWCVSMYVGAGVAMLRAFAPRAWSPASYALAVSSVTGLIEEKS